MKKSLPLFLAVLFTTQLQAQNFTGQWKGQFTDKSTSFIGWGGNRCDYVLEIECRGTDVSGYSYTYFNEGGRRYYTICRLKGTLDKASKSIEVAEVERTKTNVPVNIRNCFQVHRLTYFQQGNEQTLEGSWVPAPKQDGDCGYGSTSLTRRVLQKDNTLYNNTTTITQRPSNVNKNKTTPPAIAKNNIKPVPVTKDKTINTDVVKAPIAPVVKNNDIQKAENPPPANKDNVPNADLGFEKRNNTLIKTIEIENETFRVDLYDNGEIDGDSISLIFNNRVLLSHKRLSDKAISLDLHVDKQRDINELIMYAENLGSIPPNTALMVVTDGGKRYEVRLTSDLQISATTRFIFKPKNGQ